MTSCHLVSSPMLQLPQKCLSVREVFRQSLTWPQNHSVFSLAPITVSLTYRLWWSLLWDVQPVGDPLVHHLGSCPMEGSYQHVFFVFAWSPDFQETWNMVILKSFISRDILLLYQSVLGSSAYGFLWDLQKLSLLWHITSCQTPNLTLCWCSCDQRNGT